MLSEKEYVISAFKRNFSHFSNIPIAIYGIGKNTQYILDNFLDFNIVGLMDEARTGDIIYGKQIISFDEVLESSRRDVIPLNKFFLDISPRMCYTIIKGGNG